MAKKKLGHGVQESSAAKGGKARAQKLSAEERSKIAIAAAESRWGRSVPVAEFQGILKIADMELPCAVLSDGKTRVLTQSEFMDVMGMYYSGWVSTNRTDAERSSDVPQFLAYKALRPYVEKHLGDLQSIIVKYRTQSGKMAHGIKAEIIPRILEIWLDADEDGKLPPRQKLVAAKAKILMRGLAHVGIAALVDEATGFQAVRARDALAQILEAFVQTELRKWVRTFPAEFYEQLCRLRSVPFPPENMKLPPYFGHLTNNIVYDRLAPGVKAELKKVTPRDSNGRHKHKLFQHLTDNVGHPKLREHLASVVTLMKISPDYETFMSHLDKAIPRWDDTLPLAFD